MSDENRQANETEERFGRFVIAGCDATEAFDFLEEIFNTMPSAVDLGRVSPGFETIRSRWDTGSIFMSRYEVSQGIAIVGFVSHYH
jgi:hypothetical protein